MRRLTVLAGLLLFSTSLFSQRLYTGQKSISLQLGMVDQFKGLKQANSGVYGQIAYARVNRNMTKWVFGVQASEKYYANADQLTAVNQYLGDAGLYGAVLSNYRKNLLISLGAGLTAGHEKIGGEILYKNSEVVPASGRFVCGGYIGVEGEMFITNKLVWVLSIKERLLAGSTLETAHLNAGTGFKLMLNN